MYRYNSRNRLVSRRKPGVLATADPGNTRRLAKQLNCSLYDLGHERLALQQASLSQLLSLLVHAVSAAHLLQGFDHVRNLIAWHASAAPPQPTP